MEDYSVNEQTTTEDRKEELDRKARQAEQARERRARSAERKKALTTLNEMKTIKLQKAMARAYRSTTTTTREGKTRRYRIGPNVAEMITWLLWWEGRGELPGDWVHKSETEWVEETGLTKSKLRTARLVNEAEGLWEEGRHLRSDNRTVVKYRLNLWRVLQVANASEIENTERRLGRAKNNNTKRDTLRAELKKLKATRDDLGLIDRPASPEEGTNIDPGKEHIYGENGTSSTENGHDLADTPATLTTHPCEYSRGTRSISPDYRGVPQRSTAEDVACSNHSRGEAKPSPAPHSTPSPLEPSDSRTASTDDDGAFGSGTGPSKADEGDGASREVRDALHGSLGELMRGGDTTVGGFVAKMVQRHLKGEGFPLERLARVLREFVRVEPEMGEENFAGIVREVLDEVWAENGKQEKRK